MVFDRGRVIVAHLTAPAPREMAEAGFTTIIYYVADPAEAGIDEPDIPICKRRIACYTRLGAVLLPINGCHQPSEDEPHPMLLMAADLTQPQTSPIAGEDLREKLLAVYRHRYGLADTDLLVKSALRASELLLP